MGKFFVFKFRFQTVVICMEIVSMTIPFHIFCGGVKVIASYIDKMFMGIHAYPIFFYCIFGNR